MRNENKKRLGDLLVQSGTIKEEQLQEALKKQKTTGRRLGELLIDEGIVTEDEILSVLEIQLGIPRIYLEFTQVEEEAVASITESLASRYCIIPIAIKNDKIQVVMQDPLNIFAVDDVKIATGLEVEPLIASTNEIKSAISRYYSNQFAKKAVEDLSREQESKRNIEPKEREEELEDLKNAPVVRLIDSIIDNAVKSRASDIHIEPFEDYIRIRYRIDGELKEVLRSPKDTLGALITRIKILASLNIAEKRLPQDGRILTETEGTEVDLRVSVLPTVHGEKVVIRVLNKSGFILGKEQLGFDQYDMDKLSRIMASPHGIILVTGPTGSGKSTTLYTLLKELNKEDKNIITVEDPVEFMLEGVNQVNVNLKAGLTFASGLRAILRQDPDIIMIGEIRDSETAEIAIRSAITGHLVLSTIHTNDAPSSIARLVDMGVEPYLIASSLSGVISQRLVRRICPNCAEQYEASLYEKKLLGRPEEEKLMLSRGKGCPFCANTGYKGRVGIYEIMEFTRDHRNLVLGGASEDNIRDLSVAQGMKTLRSSCEKLVLDRITTLEEMLRATYAKL